MLDDKTWSFSSVNSYENCPKCFYLSYLQDPSLEKDQNAFAQWGTLGHSLFERYVDGELELYELGKVYEEEYDEDEEYDEEGEYDEDEEYEEYDEDGEYEDADVDAE